MVDINFILCVYACMHCFTCREFNNQMYCTGSVCDDCTLSTGFTKGTAAIETRSFFCSTHFILDSLPLKHIQSNVRSCFVHCFKPCQIHSALVIYNHSLSFPCSLMYLCYLMSASFLYLLEYHTLPVPFYPTSI